MGEITRIEKAARHRLTDRVAVRVLAKTFPPAMVDEVIDQAEAREQRRRSMPARLTVYFTLAMWLWRGHGYREVLRRLVDALGWPDDRAGPRDETGVAWSGSITKARSRLGFEPLRLLFTRVTGPVATTETPRSFWRGLRLSMIDGSNVDVPASPDNRAAFDGPGIADTVGAYPRVRLVAHAECGTKALLNATFDGCRVAEATLVERLLPSLGPGMLVMAERGLLNWSLWRRACATGAELLWRADETDELPVAERLSDGSYLSALHPSDARDAAPVTVRVVEYTVGAAVGQGRSEAFCLVTTLLDPDTAPIGEFPALYRDRWSGEHLLAAIRPDPGGESDVLLRSRHPDGIRQEMWALLCLYQAFTDLVGDTVRLL